MGIDSKLDHVHFAPSTIAYFDSPSTTLRELLSTSLCAKHNRKSKIVNQFTLTL